MSAPSVPHLWLAQWDANYNAYYYVNPERGVTQWDPPAVHAAPPAYDGGSGSAGAQQQHGALGGAGDGERRFGTLLLGAGAGTLGHKLFAGKPQQQQHYQQQGYGYPQHGYPQQQGHPSKPGGMGVGTGFALGGAAAAGGLLLGKLLNNNSHGGHGGHDGHHGHHGGKHGKHGKHHH
ncbi:hypothetical protein Q8F55_003038 [Vanrija albida]|uniref:WW domain-containing protein n=1 Tax=Vanrija albida TaxID=181172 RepID=A0ABR3QBG8_9TREE